MITEDERHDQLLPVIPHPPNGERWRAPADFEQQLYDLTGQGDGWTYMRRIAQEGTYRPVTVNTLPQGEGRAPFYVAVLPDGRLFIPVYTAGVLPPPHPDAVFEFTSIGVLADTWPHDVSILAVNPATPCERWFVVDANELQNWDRLHEELFRPDELTDRLDTRRTGVPTDQATLRGLACGALVCYHNGDPWNTLDWHGVGYTGEKDLLAKWWGLSGRDDWQSMQEELLECEASPWYWEFVLGAREWLVREQADPRVDPQLWRHCVETTLRERVEAARPDAELDEFLGELRGLIGRMLRYEARFRADDLLPPDGRVRSVRAWDLGRASCMARWGVGARYATRAEMQAALVRAGEGAAAAYGTWSEFSAGYVLGRCLHFDEEEFGAWYSNVLNAHRAMMRAWDGPYAAVSLRQ